MNTQELVAKLINYIKAGQNIQAEEELYADDIISFEQDGSSASGKEAVIAKTKAAIANIEAFHGGGASQAFVGKDSFLLVLEMDITPKGGARMQMKEYGFYKVLGGKIVEEHFFSQPLAF